MPTEEWVVKWKRNRNHRGEETVYSRSKAEKIVEEKLCLGYKVVMKKGSRKSPR